MFAITLSKTLPLRFHNEMLILQDLRLLFGILANNCKALILTASNTGRMKDFL